MKYIGSSNSNQIAAGVSFNGGNKSSDSLFDFMKSMAGTIGRAPAIFSLTDVYRQTLSNNWSFDANTIPATAASGGTLTINSQSVGSYDYTVKVGNQTISSFSNGDWFTGQSDTRSALVYVKGNLTINSGQTLIPNNRKLFLGIYVDGDLTVNGTISMSNRGSNHSGTGDSSGYVAPVDIRLANGTHGSYTNPTIPATGGTGGARWNAEGGTPQSAGSTPNFGTGGGGAGGAAREYGRTAVGGAGANGTCFSGGPAGGSARQAYIYGDSYAGDAVSNGGRGGSGAAIYYSAAGGAGNPGGSWTSSSYGSATDGASGTGGVIVIYCTGTLYGTGSLTAVGNEGGSNYGNGVIGGTGSGGGMISIFCKTNSSSLTLNANPGTSKAQPVSGTGFTAVIQSL